MNYMFNVGDMIEIDRFLYRHVGIYVSPRADGRDILHNDKNGGVVLSTLAEFSGGKPVKLRQPAPSNYFQRQEIANRALSLLGQKFDLLTFNCEHAATWAQNGEKHSPQLQGAFLLLGIFGLLALLGSSK
jgi:Lecithin retinol acyltransferase